MSSHLSQERERQGISGFRSDDGVDATPRTAGSTATRDSPESRAALRHSQPHPPAQTAQYASPLHHTVPEHCDLVSICLCQLDVAGNRPEPGGRSRW
jgi:hypothetical protein